VHGAAAGANITIGKSQHSRCVIEDPWGIAVPESNAGKVHSRPRFDQRFTHGSRCRKRGLSRFPRDSLIALPKRKFAPHELGRSQSGRRRSPPNPIEHILHEATHLIDSPTRLRVPTERDQTKRARLVSRLEQHIGCGSQLGGACVQTRRPYRCILSQNLGLNVLGEHH